MANLRRHPASWVSNVPTLPQYFGRHHTELQLEASHEVMLRNRHNSKRRPDVAEKSSVKAVQV